MRELTRIRLRTLIWAILPVSVLILLPWWVRRAAGEPRVHTWGLAQWAGLWLIANGVGIAC